MEEYVEDPEMGRQLITDSLGIWQTVFTDQQLYILLENPTYTSTVSLWGGWGGTVIYDETINDTDGSTGLTNCNCRYSLGCIAGKTCNEGRLWACTKVIGCGIWGTSTCIGLCG